MGEWGIKGRMRGYVDETGMGRWVYVEYMMSLTECVGLGLQTCPGLALPKPDTHVQSIFQKKFFRQWHGTNWFSSEFHVSPCFCL